MRIAVCISTLARPEGLERALASAIAQELAGSAAVLGEIVVVNNDPSDERPREIVARLARGASVPVTLLDEPVRGTAPPRNRALTHARGRCELIAFLDDDEEAPRGWLASLVATRARFAAHVVTGPVTPVLDADAPAWAHRMHARPTRPTGSPRPWAFTGNVLFDAALLDRIEPWFDPRFTQGEDRHFFARAAAAGARIVWCAEDAPHEFVGRARLEPAWFARRMHAIGRAVTAIERDTPARRGARMRNTAKGIAWIAIGAATWTAGLPGLVELRVRGRAHAAYGAGLVAGATLGWDSAAGGSGAGGSSPRS
jgi:glycosyltransferase involved in cell wall biosynthesis